MCAYPCCALCASNRPIQRRVSRSLAFGDRGIEERCSLTNRVPHPRLRRKSHRWSPLENHAQVVVAILCLAQSDFRLSDGPLSLILLEENNPLHEPSHLILYEIGKGAVRAEKTLKVSEAVLPISSSPVVSVKVLERVDTEHFAYWTYLGNAHRWFCDTSSIAHKTKGPAFAGPFDH